jgi:hypothetical protein
MFNLSPRALDAAYFTLKAAVCVVALIFAYNAGKDAAKAQAADKAQWLKETRRVAAEGAADAISKQKQESRTVIQRTRERMVEVPVYRDCRHDDSVRDDLNRQLRAAPSGASDPG